MKSIDCLKLYKGVINKLQSNILLDEHSKIGTGNVTSTDMNVDYVSVGIAALSQKDVISDYEFMAGLISIYHENRHVEQVHLVNESKQGYLEPLKYSYYASMCHPGYNSFDENKFNYFHCPREIEAELYGMFGAYQTCCGLYGRDRADELLINYTNEKVANGVAFVNRKFNFRYSNVDDIFDDMSDAYGESIYGKREYIPSKDENNLANWCFHKNPGLFAAFNKADEGWQMDKMLASLYLNQNSNQYLRDYLPGLSCIDWDINNTFKTKSVTEKIASKMDVRRRRSEAAEDVLQRVVSHDYFANDDMEYD